MKWEALKEWSISFAIALVPFLLAFGVLLLPRHEALGEFLVGKVCKTNSCSTGCHSCLLAGYVNGVWTSCEPPPPDPNSAIRIACTCGNLNPDCTDCKCKPTAIGTAPSTGQTISACRCVL